ncbi:helix-turn-helix transcriptional regulator [Bifidobacterium stellenboschense]|nr:helix-turn-helix transcriptional regulator [Bifidobacterium stellenboschense]
MKTKVREYRRMADMTQQELADMVYVSSRTIISIEKGRYSPSLMLAYRMARVFGVTVEDLCLLEENRLIEDKEHGYA